MKKTKNKIIFYIFLILTITNNTFAISFSELAVKLSNGLISSITKLAFSAAVVFFFWGVFQFVLNADDQGKREEGKKRILWSIIAIFIMLSIWGILGVVDRTVNLDNSHLEINFLN